MTAFRACAHRAAQTGNDAFPPLTDFGYAPSSSAFYEYMTYNVDPTLQWHIGSREPLGGRHTHLNLGALLLKRQKIEASR